MSAPRAAKASTALLAQVRATLSERRLLAGADHVLVACSGGPDSQVLLHALWSLRSEHGCRLSAVSIDHGLRSEAARELDLAQALAERLGVAFRRIAVEVASGASLQAQARRARYAALLQAASELGATRIAVGHTRDDQAETLLARLVRGSSIDGLGAIEPRRADGVVRPLLDVERSAVHAYAAQHGLSFARDPSNEDRRFLRVRIRHEWLPLLLRENPRMTQALADLADDAREASLLLQQMVEPHLALARTRAHSLRELSGPLRRRALKRLVEATLNTSLHRRHLVALERMLWVGGEVRLPGDVVARLDALGQLTFEPVSKRGRGSQRHNEEP